MSCSAPNTTTFAAWRPAVVLGTCAHAWANGAAAGVPSATAAVPATLVFAVADAARRSTAAAAPTRSQRRLCIDFPSVWFGAGSWFSGRRRLLRSHTPSQGRPVTSYDDGAVA